MPGYAQMEGHHDRPHNGPHLREPPMDQEVHFKDIVGNRTRSPLLARATKQAGADPRYGSWSWPDREFVETLVAAVSSMVEVDSVLVRVFDELLGFSEPTGQHLADPWEKNTPLPLTEGSHLAVGAGDSVRHARCTKLLPKVRVNETVLSTNSLLPPVVRGSPVTSRNIRGIGEPWV